MTLEVFGYTPSFEELSQRWPPYANAPVYLVVAKCSDGCHVYGDLIDLAEIPAIWPMIEETVQRAFARAHPAA